MRSTLSTMPLSIGNIKPGLEIGRCKIVRELGRGGMGAVYLASHKTLRIDVALKVLSPELSHSNPSLADRFIREAQMAARIRHPNVVSVMDADQDKETELYFIIQEFMAGGTLSWHLRNGPLPEKKTLHILTGIAHALAVAEEVGIVHRDIKPDNILLDSRQVPKLADLGLAKHALDAHTSLTMGGAFMGTPAYMSPDQARDAKNVTTQDDIYSLGATLYECLTGIPPFVGDTPYNIMSALLTRPTPRARDVNPAVSEPLDLICFKMMAKERSDRYKDAKSLLQELEKVQAGSSTGWKHLAAYDPRTLSPNFGDTQAVARKFGVQTDDNQNRVRQHLKTPRSLPAGNVTPGSKGDSVFVMLLSLTIGATALSLGILFFSGWDFSSLSESGKTPELAASTHTSSDHKIASQTHIPRAPAVDGDKPVHALPVLNIVQDPAFTHTPSETIPTNVPQAQAVSNPVSLAAKPDSEETPAPVATYSPVITPSPLAQLATPANLQSNPEAQPTPVFPSSTQPTDTPPLVGTNAATPIGLGTPFATGTPLLNTKPETALYARFLAAQSLPFGPPGHLLGLTGERDRFSPVPTTWNLIFFDPSARRRARYITVSHGRATSDRDYLIGLRLEYQRNEIFRESEVTIDSDQALKTAFDLYPNIQVASSSITLIRRTNFVPPVLWSIALWKREPGGDQKRFATVTLKASQDGGVITNEPSD